MAHKSVLLFLLLLTRPVLCLFDDPILSFEPREGSVPLHDATIIFANTDDTVGIQIAAESLAEDYKQITGHKPPTLEWRGSNGTLSQPVLTNDQTKLAVIIVGTVGSSLIEGLAEDGKIEIDDLKGKWETFRFSAVQKPFPGVKSGLVVAGSDMRGAMYGLYTFAEQSGQSPLHFWADVPATKHDKIYALDKVTTFGEPSVKFRGIFINDEAPALTGWWAKQTGSATVNFDVEFYEHVFDLLLRLKANFIWPAMWGSFVPEPGRMFFVDDPKNIQLANDYGIVVSTSHHEPMQRASNEWKLESAGPWNWVTNKDKVVEFMDDGVRRAALNDSYFTLGMRGENDGPIDADDPIVVLEDVFETERKILASHYGNETAAKQVWTIYKEVATYYAAGLTPPDDVTLMFTDDNWGNIQRLPTEEERQRSGGIGVYYHFEYVGRPKSWKWQNSVNIPKVYKELFQAYERGADRIWVINVGDIKPVEVPLNFAMDLAWNASRFDFDRLSSYLEDLAARDFGPEFAPEIAAALMTYSHLVGLRQFETTEGTTYSILNFEEADRVLNAWRDLADTAESLRQKVPQDRRDALYHLLVYPAVAGHNYHAVVIGQGKNAQYAFERRNSANRIAQKVLEDFEYDYDLIEEYDSLADGKWEGIMSTPKFDMNTADWRPPSRDVVANLSYVQLRQDFDYGFGNLGIYVEQSRSAYSQGRICASINPAWPTREGFSPVMRAMEPHGPKTRFIELFHRGDYRKSVEWALEAPYPWVKLSKTSGALSSDEPQQRVDVSIDWDDVPSSFNETVQITVSWKPEPYFDVVHLPVRKVDIPSDFEGFPETDGLVSIEAPHFQRSSDGDTAFAHTPGLGSRSESGSIALRPFTPGESSDDFTNAWVEYHIFIFGETTRKGVSATIWVNGALDTNPENTMQFSLVVGDTEPKFTRLLGDPAKPGDTPPEWTAEVANHVWKRTVKLGDLGPGAHTLRWQTNSPEVYLEKIVVATGGRLPDSYLGPPETPRRG